VLPLLLSPSVPIALASPFVHAALAVSLEVALFVAPAIGASLAAARFVERGEARAVFALGASPRSLVLAAWPAWLVFAAASALASATWGKEAEAPGRLIAKLLDEGRTACLEAARQTPGEPHAAVGPLASATWICLPHEAPRVVFHVPLSSAVASARSIALSSDTTSLAAEDVTLVVPAMNDHDAFHVHVDHASLEGLAPLGRRSNLPASFRAFFLGSSTCLAAIVSSFLVLVFSTGSRALALAVGLIGPVFALLGLSALEREPSPLWAYSLLPIASLLAPLALASIARATRGWYG